MTEVCPVNEKRINEKIARVNALFTVLIMAFFLITSNTWIVYFLIADFALRAFFDGEFSPLRLFSSAVINLTNTKPRMINAAPKVFAARIGLLLSSLVILFYLTSFITLAYLFGAVLIFFSFLEGAFGFCVACKIYPYIFRVSE
ncbi:MAG: DUF4395 domain-containing protein [Bacteroidales bacterium]|nr:DUF4395 domain-containing protein [Bacteroidales bacterium]